MGCGARRAVWPWAERLGLAARRPRDGTLRAQGPRPRGPHDGTPSSQPQGLCLSLRPLTPGLPPEHDAVCTGTAYLFVRNCSQNFVSLKLAFLINFGGLFLPALSGPGGRLVWALSPASAILPARCLLRLHHRSHPTQATVSPWPTDTPDNTFLQFSLLRDSSETTRHGPRTLPRRGCTQVPVKGAGKALPRHEQVVATRASGGTRISPAGSSGDGPGPPAPPTAPACSQETQEQ